MLPESGQYRVASDGLPYSFNEFIRYHGVDHRWFWDRAPVYDLQNHASDVADAEAVYPGTPSDIDIVSDAEVGLLAMDFDVVCCTVDGREFTVTCDGMTSIGWLSMHVAEIMGLTTTPDYYVGLVSVHLLYDGVVLSDIVKVKWVLRHADDMRLQVILSSERSQSFRSLT